MINVFRNIRRKLADDNKPLKYIIYAIGEIILVVVGILIALQINTWNEEKKARIEELGYINSYLIDLEKDRSDLEFNSEYGKMTIKGANSFPQEIDK